ncbi:MAG: ABC transporter permease subunit [Polyangiaceae bacterium]|nr:ABC transporter permease subunit [Polyangiaceae bacterium]
MTPFLAIVSDTWRQSKQQIVFLVLIGLMLLLTGGMLAIPKVLTGPDGKAVLGVAFQTQGTGDFETSWDEAYRAAVAKERGFEQRSLPARTAYDEAQAKYRKAVRKRQRLAEAGAAAEQVEEAKAEEETLSAESRERAKSLLALQQELLDEAQKIVDERAKGITPLEKGAEIWLSLAVRFLFTLSMWGFIAACAGYYPAMLQAGAVDVLISKPIGRHVLFFGKYAGGLVLYAAALLACYFLLFVGMGIRTGVWHAPLLGAMPLTLFAVALLWALVGAIGVLTRSTAFAIVIGYVYYVVVDSVVGLVQALKGTEIADEFEALGTISEWSGVLFPGFGRLRDAVGASVLHVPVFEGQPIVVAAAWIAACLGVAYWRFYKLDF